VGEMSSSRKAEAILIKELGSLAIRHVAS